MATYPVNDLEWSFYSHLHNRTSSVIDGVPFFHYCAEKVDLFLSENGRIRASSFSCFITEQYGIELAEIRRKNETGLPLQLFLDVAKQMFLTLGFLSRVSAFFYSCDS